MTTLPPISVIVASWQRPDELQLCLTGLAQQDHPALEVIVVADAAACAALRARDWPGKLAENPGANLALARNIGLSLAAGLVVAYIDDDAVAEPTWASRLARPFADAAVVAATGPTRGRNGISWQWHPVEVDATGADHPLPLKAETWLHQGGALRAVKPLGTNCAFRRAPLCAAGGFDMAFRFFLEDADIGLRLAAFGKTAIVPGAAVHHAFAASDRRRADRVPTDLRQIGASAQVFLRRHAEPALWADAIARLRAAEAARIIRHRAAGQIDEGGAARLMASLEAGIAEGASRDLPPLAPLLAKPPGDFTPLPGTGPRPGRLIAGRVWQAWSLRRKAVQAARAGEVATLILMSPTIRAHRHRLHPDGYWEQRGGLFGPSERAQPRLRWWRLGARVRAEAARIAPFRPI